MEGRRRGSSRRSFQLSLMAAVAAAAVVVELCNAKCSYPAIFNFGDSNSDTGAIHFVFPNHMLAENPPYGQTYFGKPVNRYSDGRLSIDFLASALGLPFLSPYLQSVGSNYAHGANFAAAGATARDVSFIAPINLAIQVSQFRVFKQQVQAVVSARGDQTYLPLPDAFSKALYVVDIGGNDFSYGYENLKLSTDQIKRQILPEVAKNVVQGVRDLYAEGARTILVKDVGPQGCEAFWLTFFPDAAKHLDAHGCSEAYNSAVRYYNSLLKGELAEARQHMPGATVAFVNTYDIIYRFVVSPGRYGFKQTTRACCGVGGLHNFDYDVQCGVSGTVAGRTVLAGPCAQPDTYLNWDGIHWTDRANRLLTREILSGTFFDVKFSLADHCDLRTI